MHNQLEYVYMVDLMVLVLLGPPLIGGVIAYRGEILAYLKNKFSPN